MSLSKVLGIFLQKFLIHLRHFKFWDGNQPKQLIQVTIKNNKVIELMDFKKQTKVNFIRLDPLMLGSIQAGAMEDRQLVQLDQLPEKFIETLLNTEDRSFYKHWGLSITGIMRAAWSNISQGEIRQGGSTLTQQLMKNHFLSNERNLWRKFREAIMAVLAEFHYDKETILQAYINEVYLGQQGSISIHGFSRASEFYFDKDLSQLNLSQIALLVGMVKGPSFYNPRKHPQRTKERRDLVLSQMLESELISQVDYESAVSQTLQVVTNAKTQTSKAPAFMDFIKRELRQEYSLSELHKDGLRLFTSLDPLMQKKSERALSERIKQLETTKKDESSLQGAIILSDISSGDILAMVGNKNPNYIGFNRAIDAYRQTGSVIKPFVYMTALKNQKNFNLITPILDEPFSYKNEDGSLWQPKNHDGQVHGQVELKQGLIHSYNLATARLALDLGIDELVEMISDAGFERELVAYPSIALGSKEMSPLEVLMLYQTLANDGIGIKASGLIAVQDHQGNLLQRYARNVEARIEPEVAFLAKYLLTQVVESGTAKSIGRSFSQTYAGKTGTTNDMKDSWYVGFGDDKLSVVWLGRDDGLSTGLTGSTGALTVWRDLFRRLQEPGVELVLPDNMLWAYPSEGFFSDWGSCENKHLVPFERDQLPSGYNVCEL